MDTNTSDKSLKLLADPHKLKKKHNPYIYFNKFKYDIENKFKYKLSNHEYEHIIQNIYQDIEIIKIINNIINQVDSHHNP
jgi:hypothetical protein